MELNLIRTISKHASGMFFFIAAVFGVLEVFMKKMNKPIKAICRKFLRIIDKSNWIQLPEETIKIFLDLVKKYEKKILYLSSLHINLKSRNKHRIYSISIIILSFIFILTFMIRKELSKPIVITIKMITDINISLIHLNYFFVSIIIWTIVLRILIKLLKNSSIKIYILRFIEQMYFSGLLIFLFLGIITFFEVNVYLSFCILIPIILFLFLFMSDISPFSLISDRNKLFSVNFLSIFSFSVILTAFSLMIGHWFMPDLWIPKTTRMIISNFLFDFFTIYTTIYFLRWAIQKKSIYRIPIAIVIDIILSALFACFALYYGLIFSDKSLSIIEILNILIAKSPDGNTFQYGPYFWVMHTTFIPTAIYLLLIIFAWFVKITLIPTVWFFGELENKNPLYIFMVIFVLIASIFNMIYLYI